MAGGSEGIGAAAAAQSTPDTATGESDFGELKAIFEQAKKDQEAITRISVEGNTGIAKFKEKPKI